jgi:hypothetical protein
MCIQLIPFESSLKYKFQVEPQTPDKQPIHESRACATILISGMRKHNCHRSLAHTLVQPSHVLCHNMFHLFKTPQTSTLVYRMALPDIALP